MSYKNQKLYKYINKKDNVLWYVKKTYSHELKKTESYNMWTPRGTFYVFQKNGPGKIKIIELETPNLNV